MIVVSDTSPIFTGKYSSSMPLNNWLGPITKDGSVEWSKYEITSHLTDP